MASRYIQRRCTASQVARVSPTLPSRSSQARTCMIRRTYVSAELCCNGITFKIVHKPKERLVPEHPREYSHLVSKGLHEAGREHGLQVQADILQQLHHFVRTCPPDRAVSMAVTP